VVLLASTAEGVAAITAGASLIAASALAAVTVYTTNRRIGGEHDRLRSELAAEAERQATALAHARELADLDDLRVLLDEVAVAIDQALVAQERAGATVRLAHRNKKDKRIADARTLIEDVAPAFVALTARLRVRLGGSDPITISVAEAGRSLAEMQAIAVWVKYGRYGPETTLDLSKAAYERLTQAAQTFYQAAVERAGARERFVDKSGAWASAPEAQDVL
jgi:hypothetical protein